MQYRDDIAGLRAVAVLPILLLHAGVAAIPGGFLGVDIFFVISGYLISRILIGEMAAERFALAGFYRRRALRILPALLVMLVAALAVGWWRLFPADLRDLSWSAATAALSGSNIWFCAPSIISATPSSRPCSTAGRWGSRSNITLSTRCC